MLVSPCRSNARLEAENAVLRHQLLMLRRKCRGRVRLTNFDRWIFVQLYRLFPSVLQVLHVIRPETLVRWHRAGFRSYWRWKSRNRGGRRQIDTDLRALIRQMTLENPTPPPQSRLADRISTSHSGRCARTGRSSLSAECATPRFYHRGDAADFTASCV